MTCSCSQNLLGRTVEGRSTAGYDYRATSQYGMGQQEGSGINYNGFAKNPPVYAGNYQTNNAGTGSAPFTPKLTIDTGSILIGGIIGLIFGYFIFTSSGRSIGHAAGTRVARKIRG